MSQQHYEHHLCLSCITGLYGCRWRRYSHSKERTSFCEQVWLVISIIGFIWAVIWLYFWILAKDDSSNFNWYLWTNLYFWFDWFFLLYCLTICVFAYAIILMTLAFCHVICGQQLNLHVIHKILMTLIILASISLTLAYALLWDGIWQLMKVSLQMTAPFLQVIAVAIFTILGWLIAGAIFKCKNQGCQLFSFLIYAALMLFLYVSPPLLINSPCICETSSIPPKPELVAHRGAEMIAPENTIASFEAAINNSVYGLESDVRISFDGVPFLMHDDNLLRTTNVKELYPDRIKEDPADFNITEIQSLNSGSWFFQKDPFRTASTITGEKRAYFQNQSIPTLAQFLKLAARYNKSVIFDLMRPPSGHPYHDSWVNLTVNVSVESGIPESQVWWLDDNQRTQVAVWAPGFIQTKGGNGDFIEDLRRERIITKTNQRYTTLDSNDIQFYKAENITSNVYVIYTGWLYSLFWCSGALSVTTGACHILKDIQSPVWHLTPVQFETIWITVDAVSLVSIISIFIIQRVRCRSLIQEEEEVIPLEGSGYLLRIESKRSGSCIGSRVKEYKVDNSIEGTNDNEDNLQQPYSALLPDDDHHDHNFEEVKLDMHL